MNYDAMSGPARDAVHDVESNSVRGPFGARRRALVHGQLSYFEPALNTRFTMSRSWRGVSAVGVRVGPAGAKVLSSQLTCPCRVLQVSALGQLPQLPPQPSGPHCRPLQLGTHAQAPAALQVSDRPQLPQEPPQPSSPHCLPSH